MQASAVDRELVFTRVFRAPRSLLFEVWTNPEHLVNWWGPFGFTTTIQEMDVRPGGVWRLVMRGPDGREYRNHIVFLEVDPPNRLVFQHQPEEGSEPVTHQTTVTFEDDGGRTRLTMRLVFATAQAKDYVVKTYHADDGGRQTLERLAEHLLVLARRDVVLTHVIDAPRELVWKVWVDPKHVANWWGPKWANNQVFEWDARTGGKFDIQMIGPQGTLFRMSGEFLEVRALERLSIHVRVSDFEGTVRLETRTMATFTEQADGRTLLTLDTHVINATDAGMEIGWKQSVERMVAEVEAIR
jgi:uncharacterized protein YndB with AHSA1/START domain